MNGSTNGGLDSVAIHYVTIKLLLVLPINFDILCTAIPFQLRI